MSTGTKEQAVAPAPVRIDPAAKEVEYTPFMSDQPIKLSAGLVQKFLCKPTAAGKVCTFEQAMRFVMLCMARKLNPWEGDAFLVGFDSKDGPEFNLITGHQAFLKRAEAHPSFDGMDSGVLVQRRDEIIELPGDFVQDGDVLIGAWAKVYRKDRSRPTYRRLKLATFNTGRSRWAKDPAGMIVKCAEGDCLRSAFPNVLGGCYVEGEMDDRPIVQTPQQRVAGVKAAPQAIANGTHTPAELVVKPEPVSEPQPVHVHAKAIEEAETEQELAAAYQAAFDDKRVPRGDRARLSGLRDERLKAIKNDFEESGDDAPTGEDMARWEEQDEQERLAATK